MEEIRLRILADTLYLEARGESQQGQEWVAWVIKNRAASNMEFWGGNDIRNVCLHPRQFECWNGRNSPLVPEELKPEEKEAWKLAKEIAETVINASLEDDPTGGCDHYNNPSKEGYPDWTENCEKVEKIGAHQFYKSK